MNGLMLREEVLLGNGAVSGRPCVPAGMSCSARAFPDSRSRLSEPTLWCEKPTFWPRR